MTLNYFGKGWAHFARILYDKPPGQRLMEERKETTVNDKRKLLYG
jgi:hypothetical protein